jgi:pimeloyl-ACP methyl ester carboxylesterase
MAVNSVEHWNPQSRVVEQVPPAVDRLGEIKAPTLAVVGDLDMPDILDIVDSIEKTVTGAKKIIVPGVAHMVNMEKPEEFNAIVLNFLGELSLDE